MPYLIRNYQDCDHDAVVDLWQCCGLLRSWNDPTQDIALCLATDTAGLLLAVDNDQVVGSAMYGFDGHRGWVYYLAAAPAYSRQGIGRALMDAVEQRVREHGGHKIQLMIRGENASVRAFYEQLGYEVEDRIIMSRRLP